MGAPGEIRTPYHLVRSQVLYPNELRAQRWVRMPPELPSGQSQSSSIDAACRREHAAPGLSLARLDKVRLCSGEFCSCRRSPADVNPVFGIAPATSRISGTGKSIRGLVPDESLRHRGIRPALSAAARRVLSDSARPQTGPDSPVVPRARRARFAARLRRPDCARSPTAVPSLLPCAPRCRHR